MGANINTVKTQVFEIIKKNQSGGYIKTTDFNNYAKLEQLSFYNEVLGASESSQQSMDTSDELKVSVNLFPNTSSLVNKPSDYMQLQSITGRVYISQTKSKLVQFQVMGQSEADASEVSGFSRAKTTYPIAVIINTPVGFFGVCVLTSRQTPRRCGQVVNAGDLLFFLATARGFLTN